MVICWWSSIKTFFFAFISSIFVSRRIPSVSFSIPTLSMSILPHRSPPSLSQAYYLSSVPRSWSSSLWQSKQFYVASIRFLEHDGTSSWEVEIEILSGIPNVDRRVGQRRGRGRRWRGFGRCDLRGFGRLERVGVKETERSRGERP